MLNIRVRDYYIYISCNSMMVHIIQLHQGTRYQNIWVTPAKILKGTFLSFLGYWSYSYPN